MNTLEDVRRDVAEFVGDSGTCPEDDRVVIAINDARRILYPLGDWKGTTEPICIKPSCGVITLPYTLDYAIRGFVACKPITIINDWFSFVRGDFSSYCGSEMKLFRQEGNFVTFNDWPCVPHKKCCPPEGFYVRVIFEDDRDCDTELTFRGVGVSRREISLTRFNHEVWRAIDARPGEDRALSLTHVVKPETKGRIRVYGQDGANEILMALYEPREINPSYTRYRSSNRHTMILAKKKYLPVRDDPTEFVDINTEALIHAMQAITDRKNRNLNGFNANMSLAKGFLNKELAGPQATSTAPLQMSTHMRVEGLNSWPY